MIKYKLLTIEGEKNFSLAFKSGKRFFGNNCMASVLFRTDVNNSSDKPLDSGQHFVIRYSVLAGKKTAKKAVMRNRLKRLLRESLRQCVGRFEKEDSFIPIESIVLSWNLAPAHPMLIRLNQVLPDVSSVFDKAVNYYKRKNQNSDYGVPRGENSTPGVN